MFFTSYVMQSSFHVHSSIVMRVYTCYAYFRHIKEPPKQNQTFLIPTQNSLGRPHTVSLGGFLSVSWPGVLGCHGDNDCWY